MVGTCVFRHLLLQPSMGVLANQLGRMILESHQRLSILEKDFVRVLDRLPGHSVEADICQTNAHTHYHESLAINRASLQKENHSLPNLIRIEEMLQWTSRGQQPFQPDLVIEDPRSQTLETPLLGRQHLIQLQHW